MFKALKYIIALIFCLYTDLTLTEKKPEPTFPDNIFPDYEPKLSPDSMLDFKPSLHNVYFSLPHASFDELPDLMNLYMEYSNKAVKNKGRWVEGNIVLGGKEKEYQPSEYELLLGEIGERILDVINNNDKKRIRELLKSQKIRVRKINFAKFTFIHYDVMGSGRFFYIDSIIKIEASLN